MSDKKIPILVPAELDYREANELACLRFHYDLGTPTELPAAGNLFTGLTLEQAKDTVTFLQKYIDRVELSREYHSRTQKH